MVSLESYNILKKNMNVEVKPVKYNWFEAVRNSHEKKKLSLTLLPSCVVTNVLGNRKTGLYSSMIITNQIHAEGYK